MALGDPRGRKQWVSARFRFSPLFVEVCVCYYLGALSAPKLDSDAGGVVWVGADGWEQGVSARFRFSPLFVELSVCAIIWARSARRKRILTRHEWNRCLGSVARTTVSSSAHWMGVCDGQHNELRVQRGVLRARR